MKAKYSGQCPRCGGVIKVWIDDISPSSSGWAHTSCTGSASMEDDQDYQPGIRADRSKKRPNEIHCPDCFMLHPVGACDK
jgi:hypothetical protein